MFRAPETLDLQNGFTINEKVDIFAFGCILYALLFFKLPFTLNDK